MKLDLLSEGLNQCCEIDSFPISLCTKSEVEFLSNLLPECKSVIILAHHIKGSLEWAWFNIDSERNKVTCPADLHLKFECEKISALLEKYNHKSFVIPYPGWCGVQFKNLANKTGLGKIGDNFMFLHRKWGAWTHLRIILTDTEITENLPKCEEVCNHCGICLTSCPASAIKEDTLLGLECDGYQDQQNASHGIDGTYILKCEICARACPLGEAPQAVVISKAK